MRDGWEVVKLAEIADRKTLKNLSAIDLVFTVSAQRGLITQEEYFSKRVASTNLTNYYVVEPGHYVFNKSYSVDAPFGVIAKNTSNSPGLVSPLYIVFGAKSGIIDQDFLGLALTSPIFWKSLEGSLKEGGRGHGALNLRVGDFFEALLPLPPIPEQKRIVDLISSVDFYIEALQQQLKSAKKSRNAVLHELLTAGGDEWVETTLGEVTQINPEQARDFDSERLIKYVDLSTVTFDNGIDSKIAPIPFNEAPGRARRIVRENDVIVATVRPYLKGFAFVNKDFNEQIASTGFCVIRADSKLILPELVWALVGSDDFVDFLIRRSTGSSYPAVRPTDISEFNFMLPPFKDQETVSQLIRTFDQLIKDSTNLINSTQDLRTGLLSDLLSGEHEIPESYDKVMGAA
jgi:restriction endonuclease S subunit